MNAFFAVLKPPLDGRKNDFLQTFFYRAQSAELDIESLDIKVSKSKKKSSRQEEAEEEDFFADMAPDIKKREEGREEIELDKEEETPEEEKAEDKGPTIAPSRYEQTFSFTKSYEL